MPPAGGCRGTLGCLCCEVPARGAQIGVAPGLRRRFHASMDDSPAQRSGHGSDRGADHDLRQDEALLGLLDDLDAWGTALQHRERVEEVRDRSRSAYAEVSLASRLMASLGLPISAQMRGVGPLTGLLDQVGQGWVRLETATHCWSLRSEALLMVRGVADRSVPEQAWSPLARLGFAAVLRRAADAGEPCLLVVDGGADRAAMVRDAVVIRVGADFVELRVEAEAGRVLVPTTAVLALRSGA